MARPNIVKQSEIPSRDETKAEGAVEATLATAGTAYAPRDSSTERREAFVAAATRAFFADGYGDTTMSSIAQAVGGSKTTLWTYFPSKEALFTAVVDDIVSHYGVALSIELPDGKKVREVLRRFADVLMDTLLSEPILNLQRLVIGEAPRFPELAQLFYDRGPRRGKARLAAYLKRKMVTGELRSGDPAMAAQQFAALCQAGIFQHALMNLQPGEQNAKAMKDIEAAIDTFCRAWLLDTDN